MINTFVKKTWIIYFICSLIIAYNTFFIGTLDYFRFFGNQTNGYDIFHGFSYIAIYSFTSINGWLATFGIGVFDFVLNINVNLNYGNITINHIETLMNFTIPFIIISICITLSSMKFRWWKNINQNAISDITTFNFASKKTFIINFAWALLSIVFVIIGIVFTIMGNVQFKHSTNSFINNNDKMIKNWKYITGVVFLVTSIINLSCASGYLLKNVYVNIQNQLQSQINNIYKNH